MVSKIDFRNSNHKHLKKRNVIQRKLSLTNLLKTSIKEFIAVAAIINLPNLPPPPQHEV